MEQVMGDERDDCDKRTRRQSERHCHSPNSTTGLVAIGITKTAHFGIPPTACCPFCKSSHLLSCSPPLRPIGNHREIKTLNLSKIFDMAQRSVGSSMKTSRGEVTMFLAICRPGRDTRSIALGH